MSPHRSIGFSTGALAKGDFQLGLELQRKHHATAVELSALRIRELKPLVEALIGGEINLDGITYVSFHAPSQYSKTEEPTVVEWLSKIKDKVGGIVVHPDTIFDFNLWKPFDSKILIENMDRRKHGRNANELSEYFERLPEAGWCFDVAHARQIDSTMLTALEMLDKFQGRLREIHISDLDSRCIHRRITRPAADAYRMLGNRIDPGIPIIIESVVSKEGIGDEMAITEGCFLQEVYAA